MRRKSAKVDRVRKGQKARKRRIWPLVVLVLIAVLGAGTMVAFAVVTAATRTPPARLAKPLLIYPVSRELPGPCQPGQRAVQGQDAQGQRCYHVTDGVTIRRVEEIRVEPGGDSTYGVSISLLPADRRDVAALTGRVVGRPILFVVDNQVVTAPRVDKPITGGKVLIAGDYTKAEADGLARSLAGTAPPPRVTPAPSPCPSPVAPVPTQPGLPSYPGYPTPGAPGGTASPGTATPGGPRPSTSTGGTSRPGGTSGSGGSSDQSEYRPGSAFAQPRPTPSTSGGGGTRTPGPPGPTPSSGVPGSGVPTPGASPGTTAQPPGATPGYPAPGGTPCPTTLPPAPGVTPVPGFTPGGTGTPFPPFPSPGQSSRPGTTPRPGTSYQPL